MTPGPQGRRTTTARRLAVVAALWLAALAGTAVPAQAVTDAPAAAAADTDLAITSLPVQVGNTLRFTVNVKNQGPSTDDAVVRMTVPPGTTFGNAVPSKGSCTTPDGAGAFQCALGTMTVNSTAKVDVFLEPHTAGQVTFTAEVQGTGADPAPANNSRSASATVRTDLAVTLADAPDPASVGDTLTYTATISNQGLLGADGVELNLTVPAGTTFLSVEPSSSCSRVESTVSCQLGRLAAGAAATVVLRVRADGIGLFTSTATVSFAGPDSNGTNNSATASTKVAGPPTDVAIAVTDSPDPALQGNTVTYTMTVANQGSNAADTVRLGTAVPAGSVYETVSTTAGTCSTTGNPASGVSCALGTLAAGASATVTLKVNATKLGDLSLTASADSAAAETDPADNSATATTKVAPKAADLSPAITFDPDPPILADGFDLRVTVTNPDVATAENVRLDVTIPDGTTILSVTSGAGICGTAEGKLTCLMDRVNGGATRAVRLRLRADRLGPISTRATVGSTTTDPNPANNTATGTTTVVGTPPPPPPPPPPPGDGGTPPPSSDPGTPPAPGGGSPVPDPELTLALAKRVKQSKARRLRFEIGANRPGSAVDLSLFSSRLGTLATRRVRFTEAGVRTVTLTLARSTFRRFKRLRRGSRLTVQAAWALPGGTVRESITLVVSRKRTITAR